jgi:hypothetical protein
VPDFEAYRIWRVQDWVPPGGVVETVAPPRENWGLIAQFDLVNTMSTPFDSTGRPPLSLGENTGLEHIVYTPACLSDARFAGLAEAMQELVDSDPQSRWFTRPPVRRPDGTIAPYMLPMAKWESYPDVLDTFFAVTARAGDPGLGILPKQATRYYHFVDDETHNGFPSYYAVVAQDHTIDWEDGQPVPTGIGIEEEPGNHFLRTTPRPEAQSAAARQGEGTNIFVVPNPATREALAEFAAREPSTDDPTGVHVMFCNLPRARNVIRVFTAAGDLLQTIDHDGRNGNGAAYWNLMTRNRQEIVSGLYLYSVHSDEDDFAPFRGRFVVIR